MLWGSSYSAQHVIDLYHQICANLAYPVKFHVYTEASRKVAEPFIHHALPDLTATHGWWYKMALFNSSLYAGPLLYLDLDIVIANDLTWITRLDTDHIWGIRDFRKLWDPAWNGYNSSVLWFDTRKFDWLWKDFNTDIMQKFYGDQDWITEKIIPQDRRFFPDESMVSWRWQCKDGGWDHKSRSYKHVGAGTSTLGASVLVFHGDPKPWSIDCPIVANLRQGKSI